MQVFRDNSKIGVQIFPSAIMYGSVSKFEQSHHQTFEIAQYEGAITSRRSPCFYPA